MQKQYSVILDLYATATQETPILYEINDNNVYPLYISLRDHSGVFTIPTGATLSIKFENDKQEAFPDLLTVINADAGRVLCNVNNAGLSLTGKITAYVYVVTVDKRLSFQPFTFTVWQAPTAEATPPEQYQSWIDSFNARLADHEARLLWLEQNGGGSGGGNFTIDNITLKLVDGKLAVNTTDDMEINKPQPITSHGVALQVGNINALLEQI